MRVATKAAPSATTSAAMWPASETSASEPVTIPARSSTTKKVATMAKLIISLVR